MAYIGVSPSNGVRRKHTYTATASQTSFSGAGAEGATLSYSDSNFVDVYQNGVKLADEDYTATSGTAIVLAQGASADDIVEIIAFDVFSVADTVSKADGGTFDNAVTITTTDNTTQLTLTSTDADAAVGPVLGFNRNSASAADNDLLGRINFIGKNDADEDVDYGIIRYKITDASNGTEDSDIAIRSMVAGTSTNRISVTSAETVFNEDGVDLDFRVESNGNANMLFVDGGTDAVIIGHNASRQTLFNTTATAALQIEGTSANTAAMSIARNSNDDNGPQLVLAKSNGTAGAAVTVVTDDALLGRISWQGADGTQTVEAARIEGFVDGTPGANDMPGRLTFSTTADGAATVTERVRIHTNGVASFNNGIALGVGTANTASNVLDDYEEGTWTATITPDVSGSITIGNGLMRYTKVGRLVTVSGLIVCAGKSSPVGAPVIGGLPFTVNNNTNGVYSGLSTGSIHIQALAGDIGVPQINIPNNSTVIAIDGFNGTGNTAISDNFGAATQIRICATYTV